MCYNHWISKLIPPLHLLTYVVRHHPGTANVFEPRGHWQKHFKCKNSLSLSRYTSYKCDKFSEGAVWNELVVRVFETLMMLINRPQQICNTETSFFLWEAVGRSPVATEYLWWFSFWFQDEWTHESLIRIQTVTQQFICFIITTFSPEFAPL